MSAVGFYGLWLAGVVDALIQHRDLVPVTTVEPRSDAGPQPRLDLQPIPGGATAGVTFRF